MEIFDLNGKLVWGWDPPVVPLNQGGQNSSAARVQGVAPAVLYKPVIPGMLAYGVLVIMGLLFVSLVAIPASLLIIMLISAGVSFIYLIIVTHTILTNPERDLIRSILPSSVSKILPRWVL